MFRATRSVTKLCEVIEHSDSRCGSGSAASVCRRSTAATDRATPAGPRLGPGALGDRPDRRRGDGDAQSGKLAVDPPVAPGLVLPRQPQHHRPHVAMHRRTARAAMRHTRPPAAHDVAVPSHDRAGSDDQPHRGEAVDGSVPASSARPGPATSNANEREAARAGRQRADGAASRSLRPSTTTPAATSPAPTRHGTRSGKSASSPQAEDHPISGRTKTCPPGTRTRDRANRDL